MDATVKMKSFIVECRRVLKVTRKPTKQELMTMMKVTGLGILLIGAIGFAIYLAAQGIYSITG